MMSGEPPRVSVVMGVYNDPAGARLALTSVRDQTFKDWEAIVVDDGSTDDTAKVLEAEAAADSRVHVVCQKNAGLTQALARGCELARGEFLCRIDADDAAHPERLAHQVTALDSDSRLGAVSSEVQFVAPHGELLEVFRPDADAERRTAAIQEQTDGFPAHGSVMMRRDAYEAAGGYRPAFYFAQDIDLWLRLSTDHLIGSVPRVLYTMRRSMGGISGANAENQSRFGELARQCHWARRERGNDSAPLASAEALAQQVREQRANRRGTTRHRNTSAKAGYLIGSQLARRGDRRAARYLAASLRRRPWHAPSWVRLAECLVRPERVADGEES